MFNRIKDFHNWKIEPKDKPLLIEDITLFMCSMVPRIAEFWDKMRNCSFVYSLESFKANCPRHRLDALKLLLGSISCQLSRPTSPECEILPVRHYYGYEDPAEPGWQDAARARAKGLMFDAKMLYHCLNIQLNADIRMLAQLAKDGTANTNMRLPEPEQEERESRAKLVTTWTTTSLARRSLLHAAEVLVLHREQNKGFDTRAMDPIAFVALATGALTIWAYCMFSGDGDIDAGTEPAGKEKEKETLFAELTNWCGKKRGLGGEAWIGVGVGIPLDIGGVRLCEGNAALLVGRFWEFIPDGWELAESIAPGISAGLEASV